MRQETRKPTNWRTTIRQALGTRAQEYERGSNELFKRLAQKHGGKAESTRANALETLHEHASLFDCLLPKESIDAAIHAATRPHLPAARRPTAVLLLARAHHAFAQLKPDDATRLWNELAQSTRKSTLEEILEKTLDARYKVMHEELKKLHLTFQERTRLIRQHAPFSEAPELPFLLQRRIIALRKKLT